MLRAAQAKLAATPPVPRSPAPPLPARVVQRAAVGEVRLPGALTGGYQKLNQLLIRYCSDYWAGHDVERNLKIGQALGLAEPEHWGHASAAAGSAGEGERAAKNQEHYQNWYLLNEERLKAVGVVEGGGGGGGDRSRVDPSLHWKKAAVKKQKKQEKKVSVKETHEENVHGGHAPSYPGEIGAWRCKECKRWYTG